MIGPADESPPYSPLELPTPPLGPPLTGGESSESSKTVKLTGPPLSPPSAEKVPP